MKKTARARFIAGLSALALAFAAHTTGPRHPASGDAFQSASPAAALPVVHRAAQGLISESRAPVRSTSGPGVALPTFAAQYLVSHVSHDVRAAASARPSASAATRGYDSTAPPALS